LDPESTSDRNNKVDCDTQTETNSRRRDCANTDEQEAVRRLEDQNRQLSKLVEKYERKTVVFNEEMEQSLQDRTSHIHDITLRYEEEKHHQLLKMTEMRDELLFYEKWLPGIRMSTWCNGYIHPLLSMVEARSSVVISVLWQKQQDRRHHHQQQ